MQQVYVHDAVLVPAPGTDPQAPVTAVGTVLGAHHTAATPDGDRLRLRILFAAAPGRVDDLRERIDTALATGDWDLVSSGCARMVAADRDEARRLLRSR